MNSSLKVELLGSDQWQRLREIRLRSLQDSPDAFGGNHETESKMEKEEWEDKFTSLDFLIVSSGKTDIGVMSIEVLNGDHGATCWIGGCWSDPRYRGHGALRTLFNFLDEQANTKDWGRQGLGVWADNEDAIAAYRAIGFSEVGEMRASQSQPGRFYIHMVRDSVVN